MDDLQIDLTVKLLAWHVIDIARSDGYVEHLLLTRLRSIAYGKDVQTQEAIAELIKSFD